MIKLVRNICGLAALALAAPTLAGTLAVNGDRQVVGVQLSDLDLNSQAGVDQLRQRIVRAAEAACDTGAYRPLWKTRAAGSCQTRAIAQARARAEVIVAQARTNGRLASQS